MIKEYFQYSKYRKTYLIPYKFWSWRAWKSQLEIIQAVWLKEQLKFGDYILTNMFIIENDSNYLGIKQLLLGQIKATKESLRIYGDVLFEEPKFIFSNKNATDPLNQQTSLGWKVNCKITL